MAAQGRWERVPAELKALDRWVCWKMVERGGRRTKMPVCAASGKMASSTDAATWCSFEQAVAAVERLGASGIGLVFGPDRAYTGLDLDHVLHDGVLEPGYRWVLEEASTYAEVSPSGDGLHLIFRGSKPEGAERCRKGPVEMYDRDRFFTITGDVVSGHGAVCTAPSVVERAYRMWIEPDYGRRQPALADTVAGVGVGCAGGAGAGGVDDADDLTDEELLCRMRGSRKGGEISALLAGDTSAQGGDHSAADMALCSYLAFWCAGDEARMDRLFRASGLMRPKWDSRRGGTTYGAQTISRAVSNATEFYKPHRGRFPGAGDAHGAAKCNGGTGSANSKPHDAGACRRAAGDENGCSGALPARSVDGACDAGVAGGASGDAGFTGDAAPCVERWHVDEAGGLWTRDADGKPVRSVSSTAPWVACDLVDVDTGDVRSLVRFKVAGRTVERALDRDILLSQNRIVAALAPLGANVSTANAKDVVCYLTDCERKLGSRRRRCRSVQHLGWGDGPLGAFMPYDREGEVRFDPAADGLVKARPFMEPAGTLAEWVAGMAPARDASMAFRTVLAASFASPLVSVLGVQTFIVYLWGRSRSGKTPTLKAAGSVWGDPTEGAEGYFRTFADTPKSIVRAAALLRDVPIIIDELQAKGSPGGQGGKRMIVEDLLYSLSIGHERGALNSDRSMMRAGSWRSLTIATGEIPIVGDATQQGAANRTLELSAEPFGELTDAQEMHRLVARQHGTAGRAFVGALRGNGRDFYREAFSGVRDAVVAAAAGHPHADNVALLAFADALAEYYVFSPGKAWEACLEGGAGLARWCLDNSTGRQGGDTDLKAMQFISEWLVRNRIHFEEGCEADRLERYGILDVRRERPGVVWCVFSSVLERALSDAGYDRTKTLRRMAGEGLLDIPRGARGYTSQRRVRGGSRVYCVCVDNEALEALLERAAAPAVLVQGGASPC